MNYTQLRRSKAYWGNACNVCFKQGDLKPCPKCNRVLYCRRDHRKQDFGHAKICHLLRNVNVPESGNEDYSYHLIAEFLHGSSRDMSEEEACMCFFPNLCAICYSDRTLYHCKNCNLVGYCSIEHELEYMKSHVMFCELMKISFMAEKYIRLYNIDIMEVDVVKFKNRNWKSMQNTIDFLQFLNFKHSKIVGSTVANDLSVDDVKICCALWSTSLASTMLSVIDALYFAKFRRELVVHIVSIEAMDSTEFWDQFDVIVRSMYRELDEIFVLVTDQVRKIEMLKVEKYFYKFLSFCNTYEEVSKTYYQVPNLVVFIQDTPFFNDNNKKSLCSLLKYRTVILLCLSPFEKVLTKIYEYIQQIIPEITIIVNKPLLNRYRDFRPKRDYDSTSDIIFRNKYYIVLEKKF